MRLAVCFALSLGVPALLGGCGAGLEDFPEPDATSSQGEADAGHPSAADGGTRRDSGAEGRSDAGAVDESDSGAPEEIDSGGGGGSDASSGRNDAGSGTGDAGADASIGSEDAGAPDSGGTCSPTWNPPSSANGNSQLPAGLDAVWAHSGKIIMAAENIKIYQIMANKGSLRYCMRWDSSRAINATERKQIETLIAKCDKQWLDKLAGWGCWPYSTVDVKVVLWAVKDRSLLTDWADSEGKVVVNSDASCPSDCGPWAPNNSFSRCSSARYDEFFWLDGSLKGYTGWGSATGFYMGADNFLNAAKSNANTETIVVHEMGHSHGLDDFYDWQPAGWKSWVMNAGSSNMATETDGWMVRDVWRHVRSKYGYPGP